MYQWTISIHIGTNYSIKHRLLGNTADHREQINICTEHTKLNYKSWYTIQSIPSLGTVHQGPINSTHRVRTIFFFSNCKQILVLRDKLSWKLVLLHLCIFKGSVHLLVLITLRRVSPEYGYFGALHMILYPP